MQKSLGLRECEVKWADEECDNFLKRKVTSSAEISLEAWTHTKFSKLKRVVCGELISYLSLFQIRKSATE